MSDTVSKVKYDRTLKEIGDLHMQLQIEKENATDYYNWYKKADKDRDEQKIRLKDLRKRCDDLESDNSALVKVLDESIKALNTCKVVLQDLMDNDFSKETITDSAAAITADLATINSVLKAITEDESEESKD